MTFRHSKDAVVYWGQYNLSKFLNAASISASMDAGETTNFASAGNREYIKGLKDATLAMEGFYSVATTEPSTEITDVLTSAFAGTTSPVVTVGLEDDTIGRRAILFLGDIVGFDIDSPVDGVITSSVDLQGSKGYEGGFWLRPLSASTSTGSNTAVNSGLTNGGTTGGGVGHLHVTSVASTFASATFKVQHSTSGSTWADLISFTATTAARVQRSTVSGTVKEQVRATISSYTATAGADTITAAVAFARYGPFKG